MQNLAPSKTLKTPQYLQIALQEVRTTENKENLLKIIEHLFLQSKKRSTCMQLNTLFLNCYHVFILLKWVERGSNPRPIG